MNRYRIFKFLGNLLVYALLLGFAYIMLFPFFFMFSTSLKLQTDTYRYPPRLIPMKPVETTVIGVEGSKPLYYVEFAGEKQEFALLNRSVPAGVFVNPVNPQETTTVVLDLVQPIGGAAN